MRPTHFSPANLSIKHRLPLLIGTLLLGIILASTWASYSGVKESALDVGGERLQNLTKQLAILLQQSNTLFLTKTFTAANDPAIKAFLQSPSQATRSGASVILQQLEAPQDQNNLQIELWNANHSLVLSVPDGASPESLDLETEFKAAAVAPFKTTGPMRVVKDVITAPGVVAVNDDSGKPTGYLVRWRRMAISPPPKQLTDLLGSEATLYFGNIQGDLLTNLERIMSKPRADLGSTGEVMQYSRDGNRVLALGRPINGTPWFVAIEFPEQPLLTQANRFLRRILLIDIVLFTVGIVGAFALSRGITRPLHSLTKAAAAITGGDYSQTVDVQYRDELGLLAAGFNAMTDKVRTSQSELEENIQALSDSEQRLQTVIENLSEGLVVSDLNGQLLNWNQAALEIHGFASLDECLLKLPEFANIFELSDLEGSVLGIEQWPLPRIIRGERLRNLEVRIRRLDSDWNRVFNYGGSIVREASGRLAAVVTMSDITERKLAQATVSHLAAIVESSAEAIIGKTLDGTITSWNKGAEELYGYTDEEVMGRSISLLIPPEHSDELQVILARLRRGESIDRYETERVTKDGKTILVSLTISPMRDSVGRLTGLSAIAHDITERRLAEDEIHRLNDELERRVIERTIQLEAANKELEAFSYSASHDLRAPLRHLAGFAELLRKNAWSHLDESGRRYVTTIIEESGRMGDLIDHLLNFSRLSRADLQKSTVDLQQLIRETVNGLPEANSDRNVSWKIGELPEVSGDPELLRLVFTNLISNALKFTRDREHPEIEIGCRVEEDEIIVFVRDNGAGFDMKYVDKLFGVFQRLHRAEEFEGTGIGLANVRRIIMRHGGQTWAQSSNGDGATFYFSLPFTEERIQV